MILNLKQKMLLKYLEEKVLLLVIFITGACVLVLEIVATRILSPFFGNTIYTVSSIIGVILTALSLGYWWGGKYADKNPNIKHFFSIIFISGLSVLILQILRNIVLPLVAYKLPITTGPLISSIFLFSIPSFLLATLSPFTIKLQEERFPKKGVGNLSGEVFFASTAGSIIGSLASGFLLIPNFGVDKIILAIALVLIFIGLIGFILSGIKKNEIIKLILSALFLLLLSALFKLSPNAPILYSKDSLYEKIIVYEDKYKERPARFLAQDRSLSSAYFLDSNELAFDYTKYFRIYKAFHKDVKNALFIGGGAYSSPSTLINEDSDVEVDVAEIEPTLFDIAKTYFGVKENPRLTNYIEDGRRFLHDSNKNYDLIFSDVYFSIFSIPMHFTTTEFFKLGKDRLSSDGIFIANVIGDISRQTPSFLFSEIKTFREVFPNSYFFAVDSPTIRGAQNIIFVGVNGNTRINFDSPEIKNSEDLILRGLEGNLIDLERFELSIYPELTDNYAPVETLSASLLKKNDNVDQGFDGEGALSTIFQLMRFGPRFVGSEGHSKTEKMIFAELDALFGEVTIQDWKQEANGQLYSLKNLVGKVNPNLDKRIILATHYDSKRFANLDSKNPRDSVPGANDSGSGVAVLMEVASQIVNKDDKPKVGIDFVFFDAEEGLKNFEWEPLGSTYFAQNLKNIYPNKIPDQAIVVDMVCDKDLDIYIEKNSAESAPDVTEKFFETASTLFPENFHKEIKFEVEDDHIPLNNEGIPSILIIDSKYPYFHTTKDTSDKCSKKSLEEVGKAILEYIYKRN